MEMMSQSQIEYCNRYLAQTSQILIEVKTADQIENIICTRERQIGNEDVDGL